MAAGPAAGQLRQAVRAGLAPVPGVRLEPCRRRAATPAPGRDRREDPGALPGGVPPAHGHQPRAVALLTAWWPMGRAQRRRRYCGANKTAAGGHRGTDHRRGHAEAVSYTHLTLPTIYS